MSPNPCFNYLKISFFSAKYENIVVNFYDLLGRVAYQHPYDISFGYNSLFLNLENVSEGNYTVEIKNKEITLLGKKALVIEQYG